MGTSCINRESSFFPAGLPLAPVEVKVIKDTPHQLRLNWGPPFTFPGETISYSVFIEDLVTGQKETVVGLTDPVYTHNVSEAQALSCHIFHFSVSSVNDVGPSINSSSIEAVHPSGRTSRYTHQLLCQHSLPQLLEQWVPYSLR